MSVTPDTSHAFKLPKVEHVENIKQEYNPVFGMVGVSVAVTVPEKYPKHPVEFEVIFDKGTPPNCIILSEE
jgi:hypothetical protein